LRIENILENGEVIAGTAETRFVKYRSKENDFKILSATITDVENPKHERLLGKTVTFQGRIEEDDVVQFKFSGKVTINEKYGGQIRLILAYPDVDINSRESLLNFLKRYVTSLQFDELCNTFEDPIEPLWNGNKEELMKVKGIGPVRVLKLIERFEKVKDDVEFIRAYTALDIDPNVSDKLLDAFQGNLSYLLEAIKKNVYQLQYIAPRLSFKECDRIYLSNGGKEDDEIRIIEVAENSFNQIKNEGDTVTQKYEVVGHANDLVENPDRVITKALEEHPDRFVRHDDGRYSSFRWFAEELMVALKLTEMMNSENNISVKDFQHIIKQEEEINGFAYTEDQLNAVDLMLKNQVVMLEGYGGTGKTASVKLLCRILTENQYTFAQCALAGKASNNMANATGCPASTIHRLLAYSGTWGYNKDNPLPQDVIIVDEISMVDVELFSALVQAIKNGNKIVVIGDLGQLEPIGIQVMRPLIESNLIPTYTYTQIHRQAAKSTIITDSIKIRNGQNPLGNMYKTGKTQEGELGDLMYFTTDDDSKVLSYSFAMFKRLIDSGEDVSDIQVITQRKADCLTINVACQQYYQNGIKKKLSQNTVSKTFDSVEVTFHEGDKVINISNNYDTLSVDGLEIPVFNGSVGIIKNISADDDMIIDFEGIGEIIFTSVKSLELAYAVTVHKLQGSQVKNLIVALANVPRMLTRQLLYTAITRAQKACFVFSSYDAIKNSVNNNALMEKQTNLRNMLIDPNAYTRMALENTKRKTPQE